MTEMKPTVSVDFETRSATDLRKTGVYKYAECPTTDIWCMAYAFDDEEPSVWVPGDDIDPRLEDHIVEGGELRAWNANFERVIWNKIMTARYGWPATRSSQWHCTMAQARAMGLPGALGQAAAVLAVEEQKDKAGQALMLRMARPRRTTDEGEHIWWNTPDKIRQLTAYCVQDVHTEVSVAKALESLSSAERNIFLLDQRINDRGMCLDVPLLRRVRDLADKSRNEINVELNRLTNGVVKSATRGPELIEWLGQYGIRTKSVDKQHVAKMLESDKLHRVIRRVLELRQAGAKSSTAKLDSMGFAVCADGRMRGLLQYHGAATGRWSGRLVQPQNFPRPSIDNDEIEAVIEKLQTGADVSEHGYGTTLASDLLRSLLIAAPGHRLMFADYSAIEARVLAWVAGEKKLVDTFREGGDVYKVMAEAIYKVPVDKVTKDQRQVGKMAILGCFEADTLVLTERGWKPILYLSTQDRVWDGEEWVTHRGVVPQGEQETHRIHGVAATADHAILTERGWREWNEVHTDPSLLLSALSSASLPSSSGSTTNALGTPAVGVPAGGKAWWIATILRVVERLDATLARNGNPDRRKRSIMDMRTSCPMSSTGNDYSTAYPPAFRDARTSATHSGCITDNAASESMLRGYPTAVNFWLTLSPWMAGTDRIWNWIASTTSGVTSRAICVLSRAARTWLTGAASLLCKSGSAVSKRKSPVYDVSYAGPRNRFTILTDKGPIIVHNCGYGMGGKRFAEQCAAMGIELDKAEAYDIVSIYRKTNAAISEYWSEIEREFLDRARKAEARGDRYMHLPLKSGRNLTYHNPRIVQRETPWGDMQDTVEVDSLNSFTRQWTAQKIWGGLLTENVVQATARDLMAGAMMRLEMSGYPVVCSVHDEIICEVPIGHGSMDEMIEIMTTPPPWAEGCPVGAEGEEGIRYRK